MNTNHTPGPWRVANGRIYSRAYQTALDLRLFVICDLDMGNDPRGEQESNARLIAAAPELLAALQELLTDKYLSDPINKDRMAKARAAIAKALTEP